MTETVPLMLMEDDSTVADMVTLQILKEVGRSSLL
jgi:hypothetical protein